jgi:hypothetical protein
MIDHVLAGWCFQRFVWYFCLSVLVCDVNNIFHGGRGKCNVVVEAVWTKFDLVRPFGGWGSNGTTPFIYISGNNVTENGPQLSPGAAFGQSVANVGDLDGDGHPDIVVGAPGESAFYNGVEYVNAGALYVLYMTFNGTVRDTARIAGNVSGGPMLFTNDQFGFSLASIGDLDGDGINEIAVGAPGYIVSSVYVLYLHPTGSVRKHRLIRGPFVGVPPPEFNSTGVTNATDNNNFNGPPIRYGSRFGSSLGKVGDFNGDGVPDLVVGSVNNFGASNAVYMLFLDSNATVLYYSHIGPGKGGAPLVPLSYSGYGSAVGVLAPLDNRTLPELIVGADLLYEAGSINEGAGEIYVHFLNSSALVVNTTVISETSSARKGIDKVIKHTVRCRTLSDDFYLVHLMLRGVETFVAA